MEHRAWHGSSFKDITTTSVARPSPYGRGYAPTRRNKMTDRIYKLTYEFHVNADDDDFAIKKVSAILPKRRTDIAWEWLHTQLEYKGESND